MFKGKGTGIGPANSAIFFDKEWLTVDNNPSSPFYGRAYLTVSRFLNGLHGSYAESPIYFAFSDDGGLTWSQPKEISGSSPLCSFQSSGAANECDEDSFSIPEVATDGTLYVHYANAQNEDEWEVPEDFDQQVMVIRSSNGGQSFTAPVAAVQLEDGLSDTPYSVIGRQTVWGHQIRWTSIGTISADPTNPAHIEVVFADRGTANPNATPGVRRRGARQRSRLRPVRRRPGQRAERLQGAVDQPRRDLDGPAGRRRDAGHAWFAWADHAPDGSLRVAYDHDDVAAGAARSRPTTRSTTCSSVRAGGSCSGRRRTSTCRSRTGPASTSTCPTGRACAVPPATPTRR